MNRKAFTLVELLAVIVILAVVLAVAIPRISSIIESAERSSFISSTKLLIKAVQTKLLEDNNFDITTINKSNMKSLLRIPDDNYSYVSFSYDTGGKIKIDLQGSDKWKNFVSCGNYDSITLVDCIIKDGLILNLDAGNSESYVLNSTEWNDLSDSDIVGSLMNGVGYDSGNGGSLTFDGVDDFIDLGTNLGEYSDNISYSFWANPNSNQIQYADIFGNHSANYTGVAFQQNTPNSNIYYFYFGTGISTWKTSAGVTMVPNVWQHIVVVKSTNKVEIYKDGVKKVDSALSGSIAAAPYNFFIADGHRPTSRHWKGSLSLFRIYNRVLSESEITQNFNALKSRYGV